MGSWIRTNAVTLILILVALLFVWFAVANVWDRMPWSTKSQLQGATTELTQVKDDKATLEAQAQQDTSIASARDVTIHIIQREEERADAAILEIQAAVTPDDKRAALYSFLCGSDLYRADPECAGYADPE